MLKTLLMVVDKTTSDFDLSFYIMIMKIMMKRMTVHLVEELGDARKGECGNSAFDRLVSRLQLVQ